jgi:crotonobetainyl-CoA:carnitine CoA-transferase CaiB-like acyl-CoA transferase
VLVDRMNYDHANWVYRKHGLEAEISDAFFRHTARELASACEGLGIPCRVVF